MNIKKGKRLSRMGFSILELLIVLVILVAILAIVGPRLLNSQKKADIKLATVQISNLETALKEYAVDMKSYPKTEDGLSALINKPADENRSRRWAGPYLDETSVPLDPWDNKYIYQFDQSNNGHDRPIIVSKGPDGELNTEDDIFNYRPSNDENDPSDDSDGDDSLEDLESIDLGGDFENSND